MFSRPALVNYFLRLFEKYLSSLLPSLGICVIDYRQARSSTDSRKFEQGGKLQKDRFRRRCSRAWLVRHWLQSRYWCVFCFSSKSFDFVRGSCGERYEKIKLPGSMFPVCLMTFRHDYSCRDRTAAIEMEIRKIILKFFVGILYRCVLLHWRPEARNVWDEIRERRWEEICSKRWPVSIRIRRSQRAIPNRRHWGATSCSRFLLKT